MSWRLGSDLFCTLTTNPIGTASDIERLPRWPSKTERARCLVRRLNPAGSFCGRAHRRPDHLDPVPLCDRSEDVRRR